MSNKWLELFVNVSGGVTITVLAFLVSIAIDLTNINGSVKFVDTDGVRRTTTIIVTNQSGAPIDLRIAVALARPEINSTTGNGSAEIEFEPERKSPVLSLSGISARAPYSITLVGDALSDHRLEVISTMKGMSLVDLNRAASGIDFSIYASVFYLQISLVVIAATFWTLRKHKLVSQFESTIERIEKRQEADEQKRREAHERYVRLNLYYRTFLQNAEKENVFWRGVLERMLLDSGVARNVCREFLSTVRKRLGLKPIVETPDNDVTLVLDALIRGERKARLDDAAKG